MGKKGVFMVCALMWLLSACRTDDEVINSEKEKLPDSTEVNGENILGLYLLCEGNMGSNKCTLDYLDLSQTPPVYNRNIYSERNPDAIKELGDVGNDIAIYGSRLWMVISLAPRISPQWSRWRM